MHVVILTVDTIFLNKAIALFIFTAAVSPLSVTAVTNLKSAISLSVQRVKLELRVLAWRLWR